METALEKCFERNLGLNEWSKEYPWFDRVLPQDRVLKYQDGNALKPGVLGLGVYQLPDGTYMIRRRGSYHDMKLTGEDIYCKSLVEVFIELTQLSYFDCNYVDTILLRIEEMMGPTPKGHEIYSRDDVRSILKIVESSPELTERVANLKLWNH